MFPDVEILGLSLYNIFFTLGIISALVILRVYGDKKNMPAKVMNFYLITGVFAIIFGYFSAIFFQALYNSIETGVFVINEHTGITFLGGLIGGAGSFLLIFYFVGKVIFKENEHKKYFNMLLNIAPCSITLAHAIGRIGCFCAGCCYGKPTDSFLGVMFPGHLEKVFPTQIFESVFLFALFIILSRMYFKDKWFTMPVYLIAYGIFRFLNEYLRGDDRGEFFIKFLSPSQGISLILVIVGVILLYFQFRKPTKTKNQS